MLIQQRFLRKKYKDPITGGDFKFLSPLEMQTRGCARRRSSACPDAQWRRGAKSRMQIAGVASRSTATSIRIYKNRQQYNQWVVTPDEVFLRNRIAGQPGQPSQPGQPGHARSQPGSRGQRSPSSPFTPGQSSSGRARAHRAAASVRPGIPLTHISNPRTL